MRCDQVLAVPDGLGIRDISVHATESQLIENLVDIKLEISLETATFSRSTRL